MEIKVIMYQALAGVSYMHQNGFMHRDIKPENYLVNNNEGTEIGLKLADFGLAKDFRNNRGNHTEYVATRWYRAPELVLRSKNYDSSVDMFALGCIMAELILGRPLFPGFSETDQLTRIVTILGTPS
jgi:serine/threonine protein kinase